MSEQPKHFEKIEAAKITPPPNLLDVVKINGRWAQVILGGNSIRYLDDNTETVIDWGDYRRTKDWKELPVEIVKESTSFTQEELNHIHWGPEQKEYPYLREVVSVFGEFEKK